MMDKQAQQTEMLLSCMKTLQNQHRRTFMPLPPLKDWEGLEMWKVMLQVSLARYGLNRYVEEDVSQPENEAERQMWENDRQDVLELMVASLQDRNLIGRINNKGWDPKDDSPRNLYVNIHAALRPESDVWLEYKKLHIGNFRNLSEFVSRLKYLRQQLKLWEFEVANDAGIRHILAAIGEAYPSLYDRSVYKWNEGALTSDSLVQDILDEAAKVDVPGRW